MKNLFAAVSGYKTYFVAFATVIYGAAEWYSGAMTQDQALAFIFGGSGLAALRHGVSGTVITLAEQLLPAILNTLQQAQSSPTVPARPPGQNSGAMGQAPGSFAAGGSMAGKVSVLIAAVILSGSMLVACASQPVEAQLATACNQIATAYREAAVLRANGKLSPAMIDTINGTVPMALSACDPNHPPADVATALANASTALQQITLASAGVH